MLEDILKEGLQALSLPCDDEMLFRFRRYLELLETRGAQMNLTAIHGEDEVARLHFLDCAAVLNACSREDCRVLDIGSGAGFPGLVLKILKPDLSVTLLDSNGKRVRFQEEVCETLGFPDVRCLCLRAEEAPAEMRESFDLVVSRAVARLNILAELCLPFVRVGGSFLAMKGPAASEELIEARQAFPLLGADARCVPYQVPGLDAGRMLVIAEKHSHTPDRYPRHFSQIRKKPL